MPTRKSHTKMLSLLVTPRDVKYNCLKTLLMSDKTLSKALNKNVPYHGSYFKEIGRKLKLGNLLTTIYIHKNVYEYDKDFYS